MITCTSSLAHYGLLSSVREMSLSNVDLSSVPAEHLASLISSVRRRVTIWIVSGCDLVTILENVKSKVLGIGDSLGSKETQALVQAMESHVKWVMLFAGVTLEIRDLMEYSAPRESMSTFSDWSKWCDSCRT